MFDRPLAVETITALADFHGWEVPANPSEAVQAPSALIAKA